MMCQRDEKGFLQLNSKGTEKIYIVNKKKKNQANENREARIIMNLHASSYVDIYITLCVQLFPDLEYGEEERLLLKNIFIVKKE